MFYQYGDLQVEEAQQILRASGGQECLEKSGWFLAGTEDRVREALTQSINKHLRPEKLTSETEAD